MIQTESARTTRGRVLVLGDDTGSFLTVVRSLGRAGLQVHVGWCRRTSPALRSRYISKVHWLPAFSNGDPAWLNELLRVLRSERYDLVIPVTDPVILPLQRWRRDIEPVTPCYLLSDSAFEVTASKRKTHELAESLNIPVPRQRRVYSFAELEDAAQEFGFPLVLKPDQSFTLDDLASRHKVLKLRSHGELRTAAHRLDREEGLLVQQHFSGIGMGVEVLARDGEILTAFQHERLHEPLMGGGSSYRQSLPLTPSLLDAAGSLMKALHYTGVAMVEFKCNRSTGAWVLIEINGRFWGSLPLTVAAGLDFPRFLYEMLCEGRTEFPTKYRRNYFARNWLADFYWFRHNRRADHSDPACMTVPVRQLPRELINLLLLRETSDTLVWDDPGPAFAEMREYVREKAHPLLSGFRFVRSRMQRATRAAASRATRVLFLCKGNICRSPFAAEALRRLIPGTTEVRSTGYLPLAGRPVPKDAVSAALEFGIDLSQHHSCLVDAQTVEWADVILLFDHENHASLREKFPEALAKSYYLGALDAAQPLEIRDPFNGGINAFRGVYRTILELLATIQAHAAARGAH